MKLHKNEGAPSGGLRKAALEQKYGLGHVSDDPEPLINYLDVSQCCVCILHAVGNRWVIDACSGLSRSASLSGSSSYGQHHSYGI